MSIPSSTIGLPKILPVTGSLAIPFVLTSALLSLNVVNTRISSNTFQGDRTISKDGKESKGIKQPDGNTYDPLLIATRIHANFLENVPVTLLLAALAELNGADRKKLTVALATFYALRVSHIVGLSQAVLPCRAIGYFGSTGLQIGFAGWLALLTKSYWGF